MRVTKRSSLAIRVLMYCGANHDRLVTKSEIARCCNTSESHLAQVINQLAKLGYLHTQRGRSGGVRLSRPMTDITIGEIFRQFEAPTPDTECFADVDNTCPLIKACHLRSVVAEAAEAFYQHLDKVVLEDMVCGNDALLEVLVSSQCEHAV